MLVQQCASVHLFLFLSLHFLFVVYSIHIGGGLLLTRCERHVGSGLTLQHKALMRDAHSERGCVFTMYQIKREDAR